MGMHGPKPWYQEFCFSVYFDGAAGRRNRRTDGGDPVASRDHRDPLVPLACGTVYQRDPCDGGCLACLAS
jgi:hypothetical protein